MAVALIIAMAMAVGFPARVYANPEGGVVAAGSVDIHVTPNVVNVNQHSDKAVIDWRSFDIDNGETTEFHQPNAAAIALNRVHSSQASVINGALKANGNVIIVNQNGVLFGRNAHVDVNGLVATTADIDNDKFMTQTNPRFDKPGNPNAAIINQGQITAKDSGLVGFVAPRVENDGVITARLGRVHLAAGDKATIDFYGDGLMEVAVSDDVRQQLVKNTGSVHADGGMVALTAAAGNRILASSIEVGGSISTQTVAQRNGHIVIAGLGNNAIMNNVETAKKPGIVSAVTVAGNLDASGTQTGQKGGSITVTGDKVQLASTARLNASGHSGGGSIKVGGDFHGQGTTPTARQLVVDRGAVIANDAFYTGNGGTTALWSDGATDFSGTITNRGGALSGNGGFVEVSGHDLLGYHGLVDTRAAHGLNGTLLLDPANLTISNALDSNVTAGTPFDSTGAATSNLNVGTLVAALGTSNVSITTAAGVGGNGDVTFIDPVAWNSAFGLNVTADRHIFVNAAITNSGTGFITLNANTAGSNITVAAPISTGGAMTLSAAQDILINGALTSGTIMGLTASGRDIISNASGILNAGGALTVASGRNTTFGASATSGGNVTVNAARDITVTAARTLTNGAASVMILNAAGGSTAGTGNLNLNGNLNVGTGALTLVSGINGTRPSWTATTTNLLRQGATFGAVNISGFLNLAMNRILNSTGDVTLNGNVTNGTITTGAAISGNNIALTAAQALTVNSSIAATGTIGLASTALDVIIGSGGSLNSTGITTLTGNRDVSIAGAVSGSGVNTTATTRDIMLASTGSITSNSQPNLISARDVTLNGNVTSGGSIGIIAPRDITVGVASTLTTSAGGTLNLQAAGGSTAGTGNLTLNGILNVGTGGLTLVSGINGTRPSWTATTTNLLRQGTTFGTVSISGFSNLTINRALNSSSTVTLTGTDTGGSITVGSTGSVSGTVLAFNSALDTVINGAVTATSTLGLTSGQDVVIGATGSTNSTGNSIFTVTRDLLINGSVNSAALLTGTVTRDIVMASGSSMGGTGNINLSGRDITLGNVTGSGNVAALASRDLTTLAGTTVTTGTVNNLGLQAAGGNPAGTGNLTLNGNISIGTGSLTLTSGINGTRPSWTATTTSLLRQGAAFGNIAISGFLGLTIDRDINSSGTVSLNGNVTGGTITVNSGRTISGTNITTNSTLDTTVNGTINASGTLGLIAARDLIIGAGGLINASGLITTTVTQDMYLNGTLDADGGYTEAVTRDILMGSGGLLDVVGNITLGGRDIILGNVTSNGNIAVTATRDLTTLASTTIQPGAANSLTLYAANNVVGGTGNLTLNGVLRPGTGTLALTSGANGTRPNYTMTTTNFIPQGATVGATTITGFMDTTINRDLNSSSNISITSFRDLTLEATYTLTPGVSSNLNLLAANNVVTGLGNLYINGILNNGSGATTLLSGVNGTRTNYTMTGANFLRQGAVYGIINITGFQDTTVDLDLNSNNSITINSFRDLNINATRTITSGNGNGITLYAANNVVAGVGNLNILGVVRAGTGALNLTSGANGTRPDFTFNNVNLQRIGATYGAITVNGFNDTFVNDNLISNGSITINSFRDLTLNAANTITTGTAGALVLRAANQVVTGIGHLILNGNMSVGTGGLTLLSGVRPTARLDFTIGTNITPNNTNFGAISINGFQDTTINRNMTANGSIAINSYRDITVTVGNTLTTCGTCSTVLTAANNAVTGTGRLNLLGNIGAGSGGFTLVSGINGTRSDWTATTTNLLQPGANFGVVSISGFNDMVINRNITGTTGVTLLSYRDLTINGGSTVTTGATGALSIRAAGGVVGGTGRLNINGNIGSGTGALTLLSGINGTRPIFTADATTLVRQGATFGAINVQGFADFIVDRVMNSGGAVSFSNNTRTTLQNDVSSGGIGTVAFSNPVVIGEGSNPVVSSANSAITFSSTIDDTIGGADETLTVNSGTALTTFSGAVNGIGLNATAVGFNFPASLGATRALKDVSIISNNGLSVPSITARKIMIRTTSGISDLTIASGRVLTASDAGDAIVLAAGRNFINNNGTGALVRSGGGRYIIYSTSPGADTTGGLTFDERRFSCSFAAPGTCAFSPTINATVSVPASGNVFLYSATPILLVVMPQAIADIIYGSAAPNLTNYAYVPFTQASGYLNAADFNNDVISGSINGQTNYTQGSNVGSYNISYLSGDLVSSLGYGFDYQTLPNAFNVTPRHVTIDLSGIASKVYDGNNAATLTGSNYTINNIYTGDLLTLGVSNSGSTYNDKNAGVGKTVTVNGLGLTGASAGNYVLDNTSAIAGMGTITPRTLNVTGLAPNRVYDATVNSSATLSDDRVSGDVLSITYGTATFGDKNVGNGKTVTINGISVTGTDGNNYSFNTSTTTSANIIPAVLTVGATGIDKVYNGNATSSITLNDNRLGSDVLTIGYGSALFPDKNVGSGRTVTVSGITVGGTDAGNYTFNTGTTTTANITPRVLTISGTGSSRVYNGTDLATVTLSDDRIGGDVLVASYGSALFDNKNVGNGKSIIVSGVALGGTDAGNYTYNTGFTTSANITPAVLTIGATGINKIYDGSANAVVNLTDNRIGGDVLILTYGSALFPDKNVGNGRTVNVGGINLAGLDSGNYTYNTTASTTANITPAVLTVGASGINKVYDGSAVAGITLNDNRISSDVLTITYGSALFPDKNVGNSRAITVSGINVTGADAGNYSFNTGTTTTANIIPATLIVSANGSGKIYDGNANASVTISDNRIGGDVLSITYGSSLFDTKNAGTGKTITVSGINVTGTDAGNYSFNTSATSTASITLKSLTVTAGNQNIIYGITVPGTTLNYSGFVVGEDATFLTTAPTASSAQTGVVNAGTYNGNYTVSGGVDGNYSFIYVSGNLIVGKKALNVTADNQTVTYGTAVAGGTLIYSGFVNGDDEFDLLSQPVLVSGQSGIVNAGTYTNNYTVSGGSSNNYTISYFNGNLVVTKKDLNITANNQSITYGQSVPGSSLSYTGFISGESTLDLDVLPTLSSAQSGLVNVGTYSGNYTVSGGSDNNYTYHYASGTLSVTPMGLNITVNNQSVTYGTVVPSTTITYSGFVNGDDEFDLDVLPTIFSGQNGIVNAGTYTNNYTASGAVSGNYSFNYIPGTLTVSKKSLNVTAGNRTVVYGTVVPGSTLTYSGFIAGEDATSLTSAPTLSSGQSGVVNAGTYAGNYSISGGASDNYYFNFTPGDLVVTARPLNVSAVPQTIVYGTNVPVGSLIYSGFAPGENASFLVTAPTVSSAQSGIVNAGTYVNNYTVGGGVSNNYSFVYAPANLVISKRTLNVTAAGQTVTYGTVVPGSTLSYSGFYGSEGVLDLTVAPTLGSARSGIVNAGTYVGNYTVGGGVATNYDFAYMPGTLVVNRAALNIVANNVGMVYGNGNVLGGYTPTGLQLGETIGSVTLATNAGTSAGGHWNAGGWTITASNARGGTFNPANYTINYVGGTLTIAKRTLTVTPVASNKTYNGTDNASVVLTNNGMAGDAINLTYASARFPDKQAGANRTVTVSGIVLHGADANNYNAPTSVITTATINQRALTITAAALNKLFDGSSAATVTLSDDHLAGDIVLVGYGSATFPDDAVGNHRTVTVAGINLTGADSANYSFAPTVYATASIYSTMPPAAPETPNTVVKVSQDTGSVFLTTSDDGIYATPSTGYVLVYLPYDAPVDNRVRNKPIRAGIGVPIIEPSAFYGEIEEI